MRVCIINPSTTSSSDDASALSSRNKYLLNPYTVPHLGIGYIAAVLEQNKYTVDIIECGRANLKVNDASLMIKEKKYDAVGISVYFFNYIYTARLIRKIRAHNPHIFIFLGGYLPSLSYREMLMNLDSFDCCVIGEGEITTLELMNRLRNNQPWHSVKGIAYKNEQGEAIFTGKRDLIDDLDSLPFPVRPFISERKVAAVITTRGCYGRCTFCGIREFFETCNGKVTRRRSPGNVIREIQDLVNNHGVQWILFNDGNFHIGSKSGRQWFDKFYRLVRGKNIKVNFLADFRADEIVKCRDILQDFIEIGLCRVNVGVESFLPGKLEFFNKQTSVEDNIKAVRIIKELRLKFTLGILIFDPIVTVDEILEYLNIVKNIGLYDDDYNILRPLSAGSNVIATTGTSLYKYVAANNLFERNENNYKFKYPRTELYYEIVKRWRPRVNAIFNKSYLAVKAEDYKEYKILDEINKKCKQLFDIDYDFLYEVGTAVVQDNLDINGGERLINKRKPLLNRVKNELDKIEKILLKHR